MVTPKVAAAAVQSAMRRAEAAEAEAASMV